MGRCHGLLPLLILHGALEYGRIVVAQLRSGAEAQWRSITGAQWRSSAVAGATPEWCSARADVPGRGASAVAPGWRAEERRTRTAVAVLVCTFRV